MLRKLAHYPGLLPFLKEKKLKFRGGKSSTLNTTEPGSRAGPGRSINMAVNSFTVSGLSSVEFLDFQEVGEGNYAVTGGKKM